MKILQLHCDYLEYQPIEKEIPSAEETSKEKRRYENIVLLLTSVEKADDSTVVRILSSELEKSRKQLVCDTFVLYPFAHLSSDLAPPEHAKEIFKEIEEYLSKNGLKIIHVPFGWNKSLTVKVKGHPLAEQSKTITPSKGEPEEKKEEVVSAALKAEDALKSTWHIIGTEGSLTPVSQFDFGKYRNLERLKNYEIEKVRAVQQTPPHVTLMQKLGMVDYEPASDPGNLRYYPKGRLVKSLLERYVTQRVSEYGGIEVETPIMYDLEHPSLASYLNRFPARQYIVKSDKKDYFLRFAACFGQFLIAKDLQLTYKQLPLKLYELTRYSFRREKSGELVGLRRLRAFTMPDCHGIVRDMDQAKEEFPKRFTLSQSVLRGIGLDEEDTELAIRFTEDFYNKNKEFIASIIKLHGRPALVEMWKERIFYFVLKWELNFIDSLDKASALSTDQIDIENAERYGIAFVDEKGEKRTPLILHNSPSGAIERDIWALLERAARLEKEGKTPMLPIWLAPTQVRFIPVASRFLSRTEEIAERLSFKHVRTDVDDREESVGKRVRDAEREWVPFVVVFGEKEAGQEEKLSVRVRGLKDPEQMSTEELVHRIQKEISDKPYLPLPLPRLMSQRPSFEKLS
jgi:threonyl-tRNA synthetase